MKIYEELEQALFSYISDINLERLLRRLIELSYDPQLSHAMYGWSFSLEDGPGGATYSTIQKIVKHTIRKEIEKLKPSHPLAGIDERMTLVAIFDKLSDLGYTPGVYKRGNVWRAHVECCTNTWEERRTPKQAMLAAIKTTLEKS